MRCRMMMLSLVAALTSVAGACGGGQETSRTTPASGTASTPAQAAPAAQARERCPLSVDQVSAAVGAPVGRPDLTICRFEPVDSRKIRPIVLFVRQFGGACGGNIPAEVGYKEEVQGLGLTAYIADMADGMNILICNGSTPFEITVDAETPQLRRDAALALARQVLAGS